MSPVKSYFYIWNFISIDMGSSIYQLTPKLPIADSQLTLWADRPLLTFWMDPAPTFAIKTCVEKCFLLYLKKNTNHISHHFSVRFFSMDGSIQNISRGRSAQSVSWLSAIGNFGVSWYMDDPISILIKFHIFQHLYSWALSHLIYHSIVWIFVCQVISNFFTFKILSY